MKIHQLTIIIFLVKRMKIKEKLIHFLGGLTQDEHNEDVNSLTKAHEVILAKLNEKEERLQRNLNALEWAIEDSRMTGRINVVRTEKPIHTIKTENIILEEAYEFHPEDEIIERAKQYIGEQLFHTLMESKLIDFKMSDDFGKKKLTGTIYVREP